MGPSSPDGYCHCKTPLVDPSIVEEDDESYCFRCGRWVEDA